MADTNNRKINIWINGQQVNNNIKDIRSGMRRLIAEQNKMTIGSKEYVESGKKIGQLKGIIDSHNKTLGRVATGWAKVKENIKSVAAGTLLAGGITGVIQKIGSAISNAVKVFTNFEKAGSKLKGILNATDEEMKILTDQSKSLGASTAFTASQVLELDTEFAKLGFPTKDIEKMAESTLNAAAAMGSELGEQAALTGAVLRSFNKDASEASHVNDVLALATTKTALDFQKLQTALPIVSATASNAGVDLERLTALLGTLADRGIDASTSATSLRNIFLKLAQDGKTWDEAMNEINNSTNKNAKAMELFDVRASTAANILAVTSNEAAEGKVKFDALERSLRNADGAAASLAETMLDNLSGDITKAQSAWEGFILSLEDGQGPLSQVFRGAVQAVTELLTVLRKINDGESFGLQVMKKARGFDQQVAESTQKLTYQLDLRGRAMDELTTKISTLRRQMSGNRNDPEKLKSLEAEREELEKQLAVVKEKNYDEEVGAKSMNEILARKRKMSENQRLLDEENAKWLARRDNDKILQLQYANAKMEEEVKHIEKIRDLNKKIAEETTVTKTTTSGGGSKEKDEKDKEAEKRKRELEKRYDDFLKVYENYQEKLKEFQDKYALEGLGKQQKETVELKQHWDEILEVQQNSIDALEQLGDNRTKKETLLLEDLYTQRMFLIEQRQNEELALEKKHAEETQKARIEAEQKINEAIAAHDQNMLDRKLTDKDREIAATYQKYQELIKIAQDNGIETADLYRAMKESLAAIDEEFAGDGEKRDPFFNMTDEEWDEFKNKVQGLVDIAGQVSQAWGMYNDMRRQQDEAELARITEMHDQRKSSLDAQLEAGLISETRYNQQVAKLDAETDAKKKKIQRDEARREKNKNIFDSIVNTASAVAQALPNLVLAGIVGAMGLAQTVLIANQPLPQLAKGGRVKKRTIAEIGEKGEEIVFSNDMITSPDTGPMLNYLADVQEGKKPRPGIYSQPNFNGMNEAIGRSKVEKQVTARTVDSPASTIRIDEMVNQNKMLNDKVDTLIKIWQNPNTRMKAYLVNDEFKTFQEDEEIGKSLADI